MTGPHGWGHRPGDQGLLPASTADGPGLELPWSGHRWVPPPSRCPSGGGDRGVPFRGRVWNHGSGRGTWRESIGQSRRHVQRERGLWSDQGAQRGWSVRAGAGGGTQRGQPDPRTPGPPDRRCFLSRAMESQGHVFTVAVWKDETVQCLLKDRCQDGPARGPGHPGGFETKEA